MSCFSRFIFQLHQRLSCVRNWGISLLSAPELRFMLADFKHMYTSTWLETKSKKWVRRAECLHIEGELDLRWYSLISNYCTCPGTSHRGCSNWGGILKVYKNMQGLRWSPTATWNRNEGASFLNSKTYYFHNAALKNLLSLHVLETHFWQRGFYLINCISMYTSEKIRCNLCASLNF